MKEPALTHLDKIYWPKDGYSKGDLIAYYREVAPVILRYLKGRPESLNRYPDGIEGEHFFQKDAKTLRLPDRVRTADVRSESKGGNIRFLICDDAATLLYLANLGCIDLNPWDSRTDSIERPDYLVMDLDPEQAPFHKVVDAALAVRDVLDEAGIKGYCKTSGARGLHVYVPLGARYDYDETRQFAEIIARLAHERLPDATSLERSPEKRKGRVYFDFLQNRRGATTAAAYCVRPRPGATVSTPLDWKEVRRGLDPADFTIRTVPKRIRRLGDLFKPVLGKGIDMAKALTRLA